MNTDIIPTINEWYADYLANGCFTAINSEWRKLPTYVIPENIELTPFPKLPSFVPNHLARNIFALNDDFEVSLKTLHFNDLDSQCVINNYDGINQVGLAFSGC